MHASQLRIRDDLKFCRLDGGVIFLDLRKDSYFRLSEPLERCFIDYLQDKECSGDEISRLVLREILVDAPSRNDSESTKRIPAPSRSIVEQGDCVRRLKFSDITTTLWITSSVRIRLKTSKLHGILSSLHDYRRSKAAPEPRTPTSPAESCLPEAAKAFLRARPYVPIETRCLLDSLSMTRFLARRGYYASIVFGVASDPFSAHCWVQAGDLLLNDSIGNVETYTPIWML